MDEKNIAYQYREYFQQPLSREEIRDMLKKLNLSAQDILRKRDKAYKENNLDAVADEETLIGYMSEHPGLIQRPIGIAAGKAVVGRPVENLLNL